MPKLKTVAQQKGGGSGHYSASSVVINIDWMVQSTEYGMWWSLPCMLYLDNDLIQDTNFKRN